MNDLKEKTPCTAGDEKYTINIPTTVDYRDRKEKLPRSTTWRKIIDQGLKYFESLRRSQNERS